MCAVVVKVPVDPNEPVRAHESVCGPEIVRPMRTRRRTGGLRRIFCPMSNASFPRSQGR